MEVVAIAAEVTPERKELPQTAEEVTAAVTEPRRKRNRIQVSTNKKPLYFYVNLAKRIMQQHNEVVLSALGMAIGTVVIIAEILKNNGFATEKKILTSTVDAKDEAKGRLIHKAKIEILLGKSENFNELVAAGKADKTNNNNNNNTNSSTNKATEEIKAAEPQQPSKDEKDEQS